MSAPRGFRHAWAPLAPAPAELRELLVGHDQVKVKTCGSCGLASAWAPTYPTGRLALRAVLAGGVWVRSTTIGGCPA